MRRDGERTEEQCKGYEWKWKADVDVEGEGGKCEKIMQERLIIIIAWDYITIFD